jgi:hypothetical protein
MLWNPKFRYLIRKLAPWILSFYGEELLAPRLTPNLEDQPLSAVRDCLLNIFAATLHIWRPFLHPQADDAPYCGDRNPLIMGKVYLKRKISTSQHRSSLSRCIPKLAYRTKQYFTLPK